MLRRFKILDLKKSKGSGIGAEMKKKYPGGRWVTMRGKSVYIKTNGTIAKETLPPGTKAEDFQGKKTTKTKKNNYDINVPKKYHPMVSSVKKAKTGGYMVRAKKGYFIDLTDTKAKKFNSQADALEAIRTIKPEKRTTKKKKATTPSPNKTRSTNLMKKLVENLFREPSSVQEHYDSLRSMEFSESDTYLKNIIKKEMNIESLEDLSDKDREYLESTCRDVTLSGGSDINKNPKLLIAIKMFHALRKKGQKQVAPENAFTPVEMYHGTSLVRVSGIAQEGFRTNGSREDFGSAAYFKSPVHDTGKPEDAGTTAKVIAEYAGEYDGAVVEAYADVRADEVLDCTQGRPPDLQKLLDAVPVISNLYISDSARKKEVAAFISFLLEDDVKAYDFNEAIKRLKEEKEYFIDLFGEVRYKWGVFREQLDGRKYDLAISPYELYAKKRGYRMIIDKFEHFPAEGFQIGVYDPEILVLRNIGTRYCEDKGLIKSKTKRNKDAGAPYCLLGYAVKDGKYTLYVGASLKEKTAEIQKSNLIRVLNVLHLQDLVKGKEMDQKYPGGRWVTIRGRPVYIMADGTISPEHKGRLRSSTKKKGEGKHDKSREARAGAEQRQSDSEEPDASRKTRTSNRKGTAKRTTQTREDRRRNRRTISEFAVEKTHTVDGTTFQETPNSRIFENNILAAKEDNPFGAFVHAYPGTDYKDMRKFMLPDGSAGFSMKSDGDIVSVFKNPKVCKEKRIVAKILKLALQQGGKKLDCFDGFLSQTYAKFGFVAKSRIPFVREFAPPGWNYERDGEPDVVFFAHNGDSVDTIETTTYPAYDETKVPFFEDYDDAEAERDKHVLQKALFVRVLNVLNPQDLVKAQGIGKEMEQKYPGGRWVTMRGRSVYIKKNGAIAPETVPKGMTAESLQDKPPTMKNNTELQVPEKYQHMIKQIDPFIKFGDGGEGFAITPQKGFGWTPTDERGQPKWAYNEAQAQTFIKNLRSDTELAKERDIAEKRAASIKKLYDIDVAWESMLGFSTINTTKQKDGSMEYDIWLEKGYYFSLGHKKNSMKTYSKKAAEEAMRSVVPVSEHIDPETNMVDDSNFYAYNRNDIPLTYRHMIDASGNSEDGGVYLDMKPSFRLHDASGVPVQTTTVYSKQQLDDFFERLDSMGFVGKAGSPKADAFIHNLFLDDVAMGSHYRSVRSMDLFGSKNYIENLIKKKFDIEDLASLSEEDRMFLKNQCADHISSAYRPKETSKPRALLALKTLHTLHQSEDRKTKPPERPFKPVEMYHGTAMYPVSQILQGGFMVSGLRSDFGKAVYFKSPDHDTGTPGEDTASVVEEFNSGAVVEAYVDISEDEVLDCLKGRPHDLVELLDAIPPNSDPFKREATGKKEVAAAISFLVEEDVTAYTYEEAINVLKEDPQERDYILDTFGKEAYVALMDEETPRVVVSPYEMYAKVMGYRMVIDELDAYQGEGWQIGVYDPEAIVVRNVGFEYDAKEGLIKSKTQQKLDGTAPICLLGYKKENGKYILHIGASVKTQPTETQKSLLLYVLYK